jgi:hypothetical protein
MLFRLAAVVGWVKLVACIASERLRKMALNQPASYFVVLGPKNV